VTPTLPPAAEEASQSGGESDPESVSAKLAGTASKDSAGDQPVSAQTVAAPKELNVAGPAKQPESGPRYTDTPHAIGNFLEILKAWEAENRR
jgi:hypothetical protein